MAYALQKEEIRNRYRKMAKAIRIFMMVIITMIALFDRQLDLETPLS